MAAPASQMPEGMEGFIDQAERVVDAIFRSAGVPIVIPYPSAGPFMDLREDRLRLGYSSKPAALSPPAQTSVPKRPRSGLLGLPCAHCRCYYPAELKKCPVCGRRERR